MVVTRVILLCLTFCCCFVYGASQHNTTSPPRMMLLQTYSPEDGIAVPLNSNGSGQNHSHVDWSKNLIVLHEQTEVHMNMGERKVIPVLIIATCWSNDVSYVLTLKSSNPSVGYFTGGQNLSFTLSCDVKDDSDPFYELEMKGFDHGVFAAFTQDKDTILTDFKSQPNAVRSVRRAIKLMNVSLEADLLGRTWLTFSSNQTSRDPAGGLGQRTTTDKVEQTANISNNGLQNGNSPDGQTVHQIPVVVFRNMRPIDIIFRVVLYTCVALTSIGMGCKTDLGIVKEVLKKPVAPVMGFIAQYVCMPLIAFTVSQVVPLDNPAVRLGIFACGVCPGGGASNIFCYLLNGDVSLSVTMTCISSVSALAMIPLWMFTLGQRFNDDKISVNVPFLKILQTLALILIPIFFGFFLNLKFPKVAAKVKKLITPVAIVTVVFILTVGIYSNLYMFRLFRGGTVAAACLLPYAGYILGGVLALISCQTWSRVKTVSIETGIQNTSVAYLMLTFSLPAPDSDLAAVGSASSAFMTPLPLLVVSVVYILYNKWKRKHANDQAGGGSEGDDDDEASSPMTEMLSSKEDKQGKEAGKLGNRI